MSIAADTDKPEEVVAMKRHHQAAARSFLSRGMEGGADAVEKTDPKPKKYRSKALEWGLAVDNALAVVTGFGFEKYDVKLMMGNAESPGTCPFLWPTLSIAPDQGPDGFAFIQGLLHGAFAPCKMNVEVFSLTT